MKKDFEHLNPLKYTFDIYLGPVWVTRFKLKTLVKYLRGKL